MGHLGKTAVLLASCIILVLSENLNVLIVMDEGNRQAENGVDTAIKYLAQNNLANINKKSVLDFMMDEEPSNAVGKVCSELDSMIDGGTPPDLVLDLTLGGMTSEVMKSLSLSLGLPSVTSTMGEEEDITEWESLTESQEKYLIQVRSPSDMFQYIIRDLVKHTHISNAVILFDDSFVMTHHYKNLLMNMPVRHTFEKMETDNETLTEQITKFVKKDIMNFVLLSSMENSQMVLKIAEDLGLIGERYSWFLGTKSTSVSFDATCCSDMRVLLFNPIESSKGVLRKMKGFGLSQEPLLETAFYADLTAKSLAAVTKMKKGGSWPEMSYTKCSEFSSGQLIVRDLDLMSGLKNSGSEDIWGQMVLSRNGESHMSFQLNLQYYKAMDKSMVESETTGTWTAGVPSSWDWESKDLEHKVAFFKERKVYKIVSVIQPPFMQWNDTRKTYEGYSFDLIEEVKNILGFEYELYMAPDGQYGEQDENGNWNGIMGELVNRKADIGIGAIKMLAERESVIDFTVPFYDRVGITILMKKTKTPTNLFKFLTVLEESVWGCIVGAYFVTSVILWIFDRWSPYSYQNNVEIYKDDDEKRHFNLKESLWFCMTTLTPQGGGEVPKSISGRLVAATWWLFAFIIIASYTANLAAFLTVSRLSTQVGSLDDLNSQSRIKFGPINGSMEAEYFQSMADIEERFYQVWKTLSLDHTITEYERSKLAVWDYPISDKYTKMWKGMQDGEPLPMTFEEALTKVREGSAEEKGAFALIGDATDIRYQELISCDVKIVGDEFNMKPYAMAVQQGNPLQDHLNDAILRLLAERKLEGMKERWWNKNENRKVCENEEGDTGAIPIEDVGGVFIVIFAGIFISLITLAAEHWYYKRKAAKVEDAETKKVAEYDEKKDQSKGENKW